MKKFLGKIIAFTVVFVMIFNFSSVTLATGLDTITKEKQNEEPMQTQKANQKEVNIIGEDKSKRKLNEKHFILSDGTTLVAMYSENVHFENNGKMEDIDNSLEKTQLEDSEVYRNKSNSYKVEFAKNTKENTKIVNLESDGYGINWFMEGAQKQSKEIKNEEKSQEKEAKVNAKVHEKINKIEARSLEQLLIEKYSTLNRGNRMNNQINGIRWNNPNYKMYIWAAQLAFPESETFVGP